MRKLIAGVDLGGTNVRIALSDQKEPEVFLSYISRKTPVNEGPAAFLDLVHEGLETCLEEIGEPREALVGLGCTIPGITDATGGTAILVTNLPGWDVYPIKSRLEQMLNLPVAVDNDVNAAALGEFWYGQGKGCHSVVYLTISTGIAAGIVVEGNLLRGYNHAAGEMGFFMPDPRLLNDNWEPNGCLELTSAGVGIARSWSENQKHNIATVSNAEDVFVAANNGDVEAQKIIDNAADYLAQAVIAIATVIDPERFVLSGSIVQHQPLIFNRICEMVEKHIPHAPEIIISSFDGDAPLIGSLALISKELAG